MNPEGRILALDYGEKRIGLALSDPNRIFAKPLCILSNKGFEQLICELQEIIVNNQVTMLIVGIPYAIDGSFTAKTEECQSVLDRLQEVLTIPVEGFDERYSTWEANEELKKMGYNWQQARKIKDAMAAAIFLREYLSK
ncbi:MAG TPA: Holliday junction resolvase RuvX [Candidatus Cloacimonas sp.]|jgi:putative Holliday junction resolvase|nr:Holliday junction resolvase RuvX [Candidatus Cloacimonas sp.]MDD2250988.1 Holliday junction resolvase RuvX [Candidatus Cloacimonadota bacterium]MCK9158604.1 Holliday junction resolvase RuvX [Candidatus Cloacimonas sp.]MCK9165365.1 Holliday junction resolvase RuvX [Candidatus Cloacimonas sp.]MDD3734720.1 Holliday junction resolvase RuvX [Candidatus Cloacimonadota bacterium]